MGHVIRTCVGCGNRDTRENLLRLVQSLPGQVVVDPRAVAPGRGAWVHPRGCINVLVKSPGRLHRTLRAKELLDVSALDQWGTSTELRPRKRVGS